MGDIIKLGASLIGSGKQKKANRRAVEALVQSGDKAITNIGDLFKVTEGQYQPYLTAGAQGMPLYTSAVTGQGFDDFVRSPGYEFRRQEGMRGIEGSAAARGLLQSGGTLKGIDRFNQDYASNEFDNYVGRLRDLTNLGFTATNNLASNRQGVGNNISDIIMAQGNARASGYVQNGAITGSQWTSAGNTLGNLFNKVGNAALSGGWG